ncbi:MAG: hypothetical protein ABSF80_05565 [Chitinispirillaceae bacterium]|jgi:poly(3-hydroxybutyrate) depolymerase
MYQRAVFCLAVLIGLTANAQTINVRGKISTQGGARPLPNATVTLVGQTLNGNSDTGGAYSIKRTTAVKAPLLVPKTENISFNNGTLEFYLSQQQSVKVEIFDIKGTLVKKDFISIVPAGVFRYNVVGKQSATNVLVVRASIGANSLTCRYLSGNSANLLQTSSANVVATNGNLAMLAVVSDSLRATANGHTPKTVKISSYDTIVNIILDSVPGQSIGCGKTLGSINKSGTYTITSSGTNRTYIIDIPTNYDKNKPYRLIFGMHCMGGSAIKVAGTDNGQDQTAYYYHIKPLATADSIPCIYVAPQGNSDGTWNPSTDLIFFSDMLKLFKDTLCIDTTRVFSCGFSFGAMYTYALSLAYPKQLRAVACYAPANYNFNPQPTNQHLPIGYYQTTGTGDGTCPWIHDSTAKQGGKYCLLEHIQDNGGTVPSTIPLATTATHVSTQFSGCNARYPVRFSSFQGVHQCNATDPGSTVDWIPVETWTFLKQF